MDTQKDRMLSGKLYEAFDSQLVADRLKTFESLHDYNNLHPSEKADRGLRILKELLGATGQNLSIEPRFHCDYGYNIYLGENFYANVGCVILDCAEVRIGDNVLLGPNVAIYTAGHPIEASDRIAGLEYAYPITIGNNVWIGGNAIILPGITIGDNVVIGAGSVVTKSIPSDTVAVGNPCRVMRESINHK